MKRHLGAHLETESTTPVEDHKRLIMHGPTTLQQISNFETRHLNYSFRFFSVTSQHCPYLSLYAEDKWRDQDVSVDLHPQLGGKSEEGVWGACLVARSKVACIICRIFPCHTCLICHCHPRTCRKGGRIESIRQRGDDLLDTGQSLLKA